MSSQQKRRGPKPHREGPDVDNPEEEASTLSIPLDVSLVEDSLTEFWIPYEGHAWNDLSLEDFPEVTNDIRYASSDDDKISPVELNCQQAAALSAVVKNVAVCHLQQWTAAMKRVVIGKILNIDADHPKWKDAMSKVQTHRNGGQNRILAKCQKPAREYLVSLDGCKYLEKFHKLPNKPKYFNNDTREEELFLPPLDHMEQFNNEATALAILHEFQNQIAWGDLFNPNVHGTPRGATRDPNPYGRSLFRKVMLLIQLEICNMARDWKNGNWVKSGGRPGYILDQIPKIDEDSWIVAFDPRTVLGHDEDMEPSKIVLLYPRPVMKLEYGVRDIAPKGSRSFNGREVTIKQKELSSFVSIFKKKKQMIVELRNKNTAKQQIQRGNIRRFAEKSKTEELPESEDEEDFNETDIDEFESNEGDDSRRRDGDDRERHGRGRQNEQQEPEDRGSRASGAREKQNSDVRRSHGNGGNVTGEKKRNNGTVKGRPIEATSVDEQQPLSPSKHPRVEGRNLPSTLSLFPFITVRTSKPEDRKLSCLIASGRHEVCFPKEPVDDDDESESETNGQGEEPIISESKYVWSFAESSTAMRQSGIDYSDSPGVSNDHPQTETPVPLPISSPAPEAPAVAFAQTQDHSFIQEAQEPSLANDPPPPYSQTRPLITNQLKGNRWDDLKYPLEKVADQAVTLLPRRSNRYRDYYPKEKNPEYSVVDSVVDMELSELEDSDDPDWEPRPRTRTETPSEIDSRSTQEQRGNKRPSESYPVSTPPRKKMAFLDISAILSRQKNTTSSPPRSSSDTTPKHHPHRQMPEPISKSCRQRVRNPKPPGSSINTPIGSGHRDSSHGFNTRSSPCPDSFGKHSTNKSGSQRPVRRSTRNSQMRDNAKASSNRKQCRISSSEFLVVV